MTVRVGINGFGRMGRLALRAAHGNPDIEVVHINEVKGGAAAAAHLIEFDSVHGRWPVPVSAGEDHITVDGRRIGFTEHAKPADISWRELGFQSGAALATVVGVLVEVPVMLSVVRVVNGSRAWYERRA